MYSCEMQYKHMAAQFYLDVFVTHSLFPPKSCLLMLKYFFNFSPIYQKVNINLIVCIIYNIDQIRVVLYHITTNLALELEFNKIVFIHSYTQNYY